MGAKLLIDTCPITFQISEGSEKGKVVIRGPFARSDVPTENKRYYSEKLWKRELGRLGESLTSRRVFGELDHPADGRTKLQRVSHILTGLHIEGNEIIGEAEVLNTPNGRILRAIAEAAGQVGVSSRGFGSTKSTSGGVEEVQDDFRLDTFDFVADPAQKTAYPRLYQEERAKIPEDGMELTLEALRMDYPGLVEELSREIRGKTLTEAEGERERAVQVAVREAVADAETRTERRMREKFSTELRRHVEQMDEAAVMRARSEAASDPTVAGAKTILEQIAAMVMPFGVPADVKAAVSERDDRIVKLEADLAERELQVQAAKKESEEMGKLAREAAYSLHLERLLRGDERRDAIISIVGDVRKFASVEDMESRVMVVREQFDAAEKKNGEKEQEKEKEKKKETEEVNKRFQAMEERLRKAEEETKTANARTRKAIETAEVAVLKSYVEGIASSRKDGDTIRKLCENARDLGEVDRIVTERDRKQEAPKPPQRRIDEDEAQRIRAKVTRGKERSLEEDTSGGPRDGRNGGRQGGPLGILNKTEFDRLAGTTR